MKREVRITILKSEVDQKLAEQYAVSGFERQHILELEGNMKEMTSRFTPIEKKY